MQIVLASASPRRREILEMIGVSDLVICPAQGEETIPENATPAQAVVALAAQKCGSVAKLFDEENVVIAADTVVSVDGKILGKPHSEAEACEMLRSLSGRQHCVYTGVAVKYKGVSVAEFEETRVCFREMTDREIDAYVATGECMDKAGAYGIQGIGGYFVSAISGDYYNVVGLPLCRLGTILSRLGVDLI